MTGWLSSASNGFFFGGWYADAGPYAGPWPLLAPGVLNPDDPAGVVDFVVALPNPATPDDATRALDGSYATNAFTARRLIDATAGLGSRDTYSAVHLPDYTAATSYDLPAGAHLYVVAYSADAPTMQPLDFVPPSYAAGGAAAAETTAGGWSDWQDGSTTVHAATYGTVNGAYTTASANEGGMTDAGAAGTGSGSAVGEGGSYPPSVPFGDANLAANNALTTDMGDGSGFGEMLGAGAPGVTLISGSGALTAVTTPDGYQESYSIQLFGAIHAWTIIASPVPDAQGQDVEIGNPPAPVDTWPNQPYGVQLEQLDASSFPEPQIIWQDFDDYIIPGDPAGTGSGGAFDITGLIGTSIGGAPDGVNVWSLPGDGTFEQDGFGPDTGVVAGWPVDRLPSYPVDADNTGAGGFAPLPLPLSTSQGARVVYFSVGMTGAISVLGPPDPPTPTGPEVGSGGTVSNASATATMAVNTDLYITDTASTFGDETHIGLPYTAVNPRWRYWLPNPVVPSAVLRTVGGHFDTTPGTTVRMLQPSGRWLPIVKNA